MKHFLLAVLLAMTPLASWAQAWPQKPVKWILPLGPGSGADLSARLLADRLSRRWGHAVVVENRPGGDGVLAITAVITARDDHTLLYGPSASYVGHPYTLEKIPYDRSELQPVARVSNTVVVIAVPASLKVQSLKELITMMREEPGKLNWSSIVGITDIIIEGFLKGAGLSAVKVAYKNPVAGMTDLIEGRLHFYSSAYAIVRGNAQAGKLRVLAVQNRSRVAGLNLPTVEEEGYPGLNFDGLVGIWSARGSNLPDAARARVAADIKTELADPALADKLTASGQILSAGTAAELAANIDEQAGHLAKFANALGLKAKQ